MKIRFILFALFYLAITSTSYGQNTPPLLPGNVGIGTLTPASPLSVNGNGDLRWSIYAHTRSTSNGSKGIFAQANRPTGFADRVVANQGNIESGRGYAIGVYGSSYTASPSNAGRSYGVWAQAGNATNTANYGLYAQLIGSHSGTAVFGHDRVNNPSASTLLPSGISYAGYFIGRGYFSDNVGIGYTNPYYRLQVNGDVYASGLFLGSDKRFKKNIHLLKGSLEKINQLEGVSYNFKTEGWKEHNFTDKDQIGFIAQKLRAIFPELVNEDKEGYLAVNYVALIPVLTEAIKELDTKNTELEVHLEEKMTELEETRVKVETLEERLEKLEALMQGNQVESVISPKKEQDSSFENEGVFLKQNRPNPSKNSTEIEYVLTNDLRNAQFILTDMSGKQLQQFQLNDTKGIITVNTSLLTAGTYVYSILANGKIAASQKMVVQH